MKPKRINKKLLLKKQTVASLQDFEMRVLRGGFHTQATCDYTEPWDGCNTADVSCEDCLDVQDTAVTWWPIECTFFC